MAGCSLTQRRSRLRPAGCCTTGIQAPVEQSTISDATTASMTQWSVRLDDLGLSAAIADERCNTAGRSGFRANCAFGSKPARSVPLYRHTKQQFRRRSKQPQRSCLWRPKLCPRLTRNSPAGASRAPPPDVGRAGWGLVTTHRRRARRDRNESSKKQIGLPLRPDGARPWTRAARGGIGSTTSEEAPILKWARR